jgi:hypothetical protein
MPRLGLFLSQRQKDNGPRVYMDCGQAVGMAMNRRDTTPRPGYELNLSQPASLSAY